MSFRVTMTARTEGIRPLAPVRWRAFEGMCGVYWQAAAERGARGYYIGADPRVVLFFEDVSRHVLLGDSDAVFEGQGPARPMLRALYIPAGVPIWTRFSAAHVFSHLDLHFSRDWLLARLAPMMGQAAAEAALRRPVELQDLRGRLAVAAALVEELAAPDRAPLFAESLAIALLAGIIDQGETPADTPVAGGLSPAQMRRLRLRLAEQGGRMLGTAELAATAGLSESWFCQAFKKTTGKTPRQWQQDQRMALVKEALGAGEMSLSDIAARFGFADQAHLTRAFRQAEGLPPAAWRRALRLP